MAMKPLVFPPYPVHQGTVHVSQSRIQGRLVKASIVVDPAPQDWIEHARQVLQRFVRLQMDAPAVDGLPHRLCRFIADPWREGDKAEFIPIKRQVPTEPGNPVLRCQYRKFLSPMGSEAW